MKATADLPGAPDANSALAGLGTEQVSANRRRFGDGVGGHEHVDFDEVGSAGIGNAHGYPGQPLSVVHFDPKLLSCIKIPGHVERGRFHPHAHMIGARGSPTSERERAADVLCTTGQ